MMRVIQGSNNDNGKRLVMAEVGGEKERESGAVGCHRTGGCQSRAYYGAKTTTAGATVSGFPLTVPGS